MRIYGVRWELTDDMLPSAAELVLSHGFTVRGFMCGAWCVCEDETESPDALALCDDSHWEALTPAWCERPR